MAAVSNAVDGRHTRYATIAVRAADDRRYTTIAVKSPQQNITNASHHNQYLPAILAYFPVLENISRGIYLSFVCPTKLYCHTKGGILCFSTQERARVLQEKT